MAGFMVSLFCFVAVAAMAILAVTRHRIFVICGLYCFYSLLTVLDPETVPRLGPITIYRAIYLIMFVSIVARLVQDGNFLSQMRRLPLASYFFLVLLILASSLYSQTSHTFIAEGAPTVWDSMIVMLLFWMAASQVQREVDLKIMAATTVLVSLVLCVWVVWNAAQLNFAAAGRGGIEVNQNYVAAFLLLGGLPLVYLLFTAGKLWLKLLSWPLLIVVLLGALILASRGIFAGFIAAVIWIAGTSVRGRRRSTLVVAGASLVLIVGVALMLPGGGGLLARFQEGDLATLNERTILWSYSFKHFSESSLVRMIFGQGLSSQNVVLGPYVRYGALNYHNQYLKFLMEQGVVGVAAFLVFLYAVIRQVLRSDHPLKPVMLGWIGFLMVASLSGTLADNHEFWILFGVAAGVCALPNPPKKETGPLASRIVPQPSLFPRAMGGA